MKNVVRWGVFIGFFLLITPLKNYSQTPSAQPRHVAVSLHENMLNAFFASIGKVTGKGEKSGVKYNWIVVDPVIDIEPGTANFTKSI